MFRLCSIYGSVFVQSAFWLCSVGYIYVPWTVLSTFCIWFQLCSVNLFRLCSVYVPSILPLCSIHGSINVPSAVPARFCPKRYSYVPTILCLCSVLDLKRVEFICTFFVCKSCFKSLRHELKLLCSNYVLSRNSFQSNKKIWNSAACWGQMIFLPRLCHSRNLHEASHGSDPKAGK